MIIALLLGVALGSLLGVLRELRHREPYRRVKVTVPAPRPPSFDRADFRAALLRSKAKREAAGDSTVLATNVLELMDYVDALERHTR